MKKVGIYKITSPTGKVYIGQSWDLEEGIERYKNCIPERHKGQRILYNSFCKHGSLNHTYEILKELPDDVQQTLLDECEISLISEYRNSGFEMLNLQKGGRGGKHSEESKKKMSSSHTGKKLSIEHVSKIVNANTGKKRSKDYKQRMSELHTGKIHSEETKQKISEIKKEYFQTHQVHNKGKKLDEVGRKILSDASTSKVKVLQFTKTGDFVKEWDSIVQAARELEMIPAHITRVCKGIRPSAKNFIWRYKE